jgi:hypothetical protein
VNLQNAWCNNKNKKIKIKKTLCTSDLLARPLPSSVIVYLCKLCVSCTYQCHQQLIFCLPYQVSAHLISFQFFWHRRCDTDACVFFTSFDGAGDMLVHVILVVGSCYTHTTTQRAQRVNILFVYCNCGVFYIFIKLDFFLFCILYNETKNAQLIDKFIMLHLHVSTLSCRPLGARS